MNPLDRNLQELRGLARDLAQTAPADQPTITLALVRRAAMRVADVCELLAEEVERVREAVGRRAR